MNVCFTKLMRQLSSSLFSKRKKLQFRQCIVVFFHLPRKIDIKGFYFLTFDEPKLFICKTGGMYLLVEWKLSNYRLLVEQAGASWLTCQLQ